MFLQSPSQLILASNSQSRASILKSIGLSIQISPSHIDESVIKEDFSAQGKSPGQTAMALAVAKATHVSEKKPEAYVIGADSLIHCEGHWFDKASSLPEARSQLQRLAGKTHTIETAVCVVRNKQRVWSHLSSPELTMRSFSEGFLNSYMEYSGERLLHCVGCYHIEGPGIHLFEKIQGDLFAVMGLPVLPLLAYFRDEGILQK